MMEKPMRTGSMPNIRDTARGTTKKNPCRPGYVQKGMKMQRGKKVPNCVPVKSGGKKK